MKLGLGLGNDGYVSIFLEFHQRFVIFLYRSCPLSLRKHKSQKCQSILNAERGLQFTSHIGLTQGIQESEAIKQVKQ